MEVLKTQECDISLLINRDRMRPQVHAFEDLLLETNWGNFVCVYFFIKHIILSASKCYRTHCQGPSRARVL